MRISQLSIAIACVFAQGAFAQSITEVQAKEASSKTLEPTLSTSYLRSAAGRDSAYFKEIWASEIKLSYQLPQEASLRLTTGLSRDLDALEERYLMDSTSLEYYSKEVELLADNKLQYSLQGILPTNKDNREYLSYRGSLGFNLSLSHEWKFSTLIDSAALSWDNGITRHLYRYDASKNGTPNTVWEGSTSAAAKVVFYEIFNLTGSYGLAKAQKSNGTWIDPDYTYSVAAAVEVGKKLVLALSQSLESQAISYDAQTAQFALYDYRKTVYKAAASYTF